MNKPAQGWRALVTGAGGFIGSHLTEQLLAEGAAVRAFVRYTSRGTAGWLDTISTETADQLEIVYGDLRDPDAVARAVSGCTHVFHLGALIAIPYSYQNPREFVDVNVSGTQNVLEAVRAHKPERAIFISTSEVFGSAQYVPMSEAHPKVAQSPYAATKVAADALVLSYHRSFGLPTVIARPFNTYGPRQSLRAIIPAIIAQALGGGPLRLGSLTPTRDFNYVSDTVLGIIACSRSSQAEGQEFNLGTGKEIAIGELAQRICDMVGVPCQIETDERRLRPGKSEVDRLCADSGRAREILGWSPQIPLDSGLTRTQEWLMSQDQERWVKEHQL